MLTRTPYYCVNCLLILLMCCFAALTIWGSEVRFAASLLMWESQASQLTSAHFCNWGQYRGLSPEKNHPRAINHVFFSHSH
ncbi:hypothetical protein C8R48DRAFT_690009 [Suillus tomentosus]|nr:hypothetical protein C8R48DRAFT_690009 [Suillus tomentosus]